jgi:hypothetical protein
MASHGPADHLTAEDKANIVATGICPYCRGVDPTHPRPAEAPARESLVDHCHHLFGEKHRPCTSGWLTCENCNAYGPVTNFVRG